MKVLDKVNLSINTIERYRRKINKKNVKNEQAWLYKSLNVISAVVYIRDLEPWLKIATCLKNEY